MENLSFKTSWQDLKDHMKAAGEVAHADIFTRKSGASKGCGYCFFRWFDKQKIKRWVEFATEEDAEKALKNLDKSTLDGRELTLKPFTDKPEKPAKTRERPRERSRSRSRSRSPDPAIKRRQLYVGNLPFSMTWQQLKDVFSQYAKVERADIIMRKDVIFGL